MQRVELPRDMVAHLLEPDELPHGRRRIVLAAMDVANAGEGRSLTDSVGVVDAIIRAVVATWTVHPPGATEPLATPWTDPESLELIPSDVYDALAAHVRPLLPSLTPLSSTKAEAAEDPKSPPPEQPSPSAVTPASTRKP